MLLKSLIIFAVTYNNVEFVTTAGIRNEISNETPPVFDTIVVGLGAAGTGALSKLARRGRSVLGLEAMDRVGGRVKTVPFGDGLVEVGAEWIHGTNNSVTYELAVANNITVSNQDGASRVFRSNGSELDRELVKDLIENCMDETDLAKKDQSLGEFFTRTCLDYLSKNKPELAKNEAFVAQWLDFFGLYMVGSDAADDWNDLSSLSQYEDLDEYLRTSWHKLGYKTLFEILLSQKNDRMCGQQPFISTSRCLDYLINNKPELAKNEAFIAQWLDFFALFVITGDAADDWSEVSTLTTYEELDEYYTTSWHRLGYNTLFEILLNTYNNGPGLPTAEIKLNKEVTQVVWPQDPTSDVVVKCADGSEYKAKHVIVTVSLGVLKHSYQTLFSPPLPEPKIEAIKDISMGVLGKIILSFEKRWWSDDDMLFGFMWNKEDLEKLPQDETWTSRIVVASYSMGADNVLVLWMSGATARHIEPLSDEVVKEHAMKLLRRFMGASVPEATGIIKTSWYSNPFTRGTYTYDNRATPTHPHIRADLATPLADATNQPRVLFAGEATNELHFSTVHGALETGLREANRLLGEDLSARTLN